MHTKHLAKVIHWFSAHIFALLSTFVQLCGDERLGQVAGVILLDQ